MPFCDTCQSSDKRPAEMVTASQCRSCKNQKQRQWRLRNLARLQIYRNSPAYRTRFYENRNRMAVSTPRNFLKAQLRVAERHSKARSTQTAFTINLEYLMNLWTAQSGLCAVTSLPMDHKRRCLKSVSIDRIDSAGGYEVGNIQLVCKFVNLAKSYHTNEEITAVLEECHQLKLARS